MCGFGKRFRRAGYSVPKPLIEIDGKPIVHHVVDMFPGESEFVFICNELHLNDPTYKMRETLNKICPSGRIVSTPSHELGPIYSVLQATNVIKPTDPVIVNYCDFTCYWDWHHFKRFVEATECSGAIPAYKGFHPHSLGTTNYAYLREKGGWVQDIQEKQPYTNNRMEEYASSGTYYFRSAQVMEEVFRSVMDQDLNVGGEYYVSLAYKLLLQNKEPIAVYPIQHFMQWGTPEDVVEYNSWSKAFQTLITDSKSKPPPKGTLVVPMAGLGQRFANNGYTITKPMIPVSGKPMAIQATNDLPDAEHHVFVLRADMRECVDLKNHLKVRYPNSITKTIDRVTEGQACTASIGLDAVTTNCSPITIGSCDSGALYDDEFFNRYIQDPSVDIIVWGVRGHPNAVRNPNMVSWIDEVGGWVRSISVKKPLNNPETDPIVLGTFTFKRAEDFRHALDRLIERKGQINGEYYIDALINDAIELGLNCRLFEVDSYLCWGTPNDLRTFEYWQSCFHKWGNHPYRLELDGRIPREQVAILEAKYQATIPALPSNPS